MNVFESHRNITFQTFSWQFRESLPFNKLMHCVNMKLKRERMRAKKAMLEAMKTGNNKYRVLFKQKWWLFVICFTQYMHSTLDWKTFSIILRLKNSMKWCKLLIIIQRTNLKWTHTEKKKTHTHSSYSLWIEHAVFR